MSKELIKLTRNLIKKRSITPKDNGAMNIIKKKVKNLGFLNKDLPFGNEKKGNIILNLYSIRKIKSEKKVQPKTLCFAGHTDVVPVGDESKWKFNPFSAVVHQKKLYGRGASDMKGAIAAWIVACEEVIRNKKINISLAILITGDEEGIAEKFA